MDGLDRSCPEVVDDAVIVPAGSMNWREAMVVENPL
jgi:hypothetical protein